MAITYVGGVAGGRAGATSTTTQSINGTLTGGSNTSPQEGDLVVVWCSAAGDGTGAAPNQFVSGNTSGAYQNEAMQSITTVTYDAYAALNWQFMGATPDTTITIPSSGNARNAQRWAIHVFRGVDTTNPRDVTSVNSSATASGRPNPSSISPTTSGAWILWCGASAAATGAAYTAPTDFATNWRGGTTADTADCMDGFGYYTGWTSGAYDPAAITAGGTTNAADSWVAKSVALRPAPNAYTLTANHGTYSITGQSATIDRNRVLTPSHGTYSITGQSADIIFTPLATGYELTANHGTYSITGQSADLVKGRVLSANNGSYSITGQSATIERDRLLTASAGSYTVTGQSATLTYTPLAAAYELIAQSGTYTVTGQSATLLKDKLLVGSAGTYSVSGQDATIARGSVLDAQAGSYTVTGRTATIAYSGSTGYELICEPGTYQIGDGYVEVGYWESGYIGQAVITVGRSVVGAARGSRTRKPRRTYLERDGKILVFETASDAAAYVAAEKAQEAMQEMVQEGPKTAPVAPKPLKARSVPVEVDLAAWEAFYARLTVQMEIAEVINSEAWDALQAWLKQLADEEDDMEVLLLL